MQAFSATDGADMVSMKLDTLRETDSLHDREAAARTHSSSSGLRKTVQAGEECAADAFSHIADAKIDGTASLQVHPFFTPPVRGLFLMPPYQQPQNTI